jgi:elongation factor 3
VERAGLQGLTAAAGWCGGSPTQAIKDFGGGIVIISHHNEFVSALCNERWIVGGGKMVRRGG